MAVDIKSKHTDDIQVSYLTFDRYRIEVVKAMDARAGSLYECWMFSDGGLSGASGEERAYFDDWFSQRPAISNFAAMPDCGFSLSPKECRQLKNALKEGLPEGFSFVCNDRLSARGENGKYVLPTMDLHQRFCQKLEACARYGVKLYGE